MLFSDRPHSLPCSTRLAVGQVLRKAPNVQPDRLRRRRTPVQGAVLAALLSIALTACASDAPQDGFLKPEGRYPRMINRVAYPTFIIAGLMLAFVYALVIYCVVKFRRKHDDDIPVQVHGHTTGEILWTAGPALLLAVIGVFSVNTIFQVARTPKNAYDITVVGHQWWWEYQYPKSGETKLNPKQSVVDDPNRPGKKIGGVLQEDAAYVSTANELHIPAGQPVRLAITSMDVMHNYWVPKLSGKIYAIPGRINYLNLEADTDLVKDGTSATLYGQCAEFCGTSHANMRFKVVVDTPAEFQKWLARQEAAAATPTSELAKAGEEIFKGSGACSTCHYLQSDKGYDPTVDAGKIGPNLTHVGSRQHFAGAIAPMDDVNLRAWLKNPQAFKPGAKMVIRTLSDDEITKLVAYIRSLK